MSMHLCFYGTERVTIPWHCFRPSQNERNTTVIEKQTTENTWWEQKMQEEQPCMAHLQAPPPTTTSEHVGKDCCFLPKKLHVRLVAWSQGSKCNFF